MALGVFAIIGLAIELSIDASTRGDARALGRLARRVLRRRRRDDLGSPAATGRRAARSPPRSASPRSTLVAFLAAALTRTMGPHEPSYVDLVFLAALVPLGFAVRAEFRAHFDARERREIDGRRGVDDAGRRVARATC